MARTFDDLSLLTSVQISGSDWFIFRDADGGSGSGAEKGITLTNLTSAIVSLGLTGGVSAIVSSNLVADRVVVSNGSGKVAASSVTATELGYLSGATSALQSQLNAKAPLASPAMIGTPTAPTAAANTNTTQVATTAFVQQELAAAVTGLLEFKGNLDCSANPNYPAAGKGDVYYASVAGRVGGGSGKTVAIGDAIVAKADNAGGTEAGVGAIWFVLEKNLEGALLSASNLSDVASASTARSNLGLTALATLAPPTEDGEYHLLRSSGVLSWISSWQVSITSDGGGPTASVNAAENQTAVTTVTATITGGSGNTTPTKVYSITGGADAALFSINSSTGVLTFVSGRDYETPTDANADGIYEVIVRVAAGGASDTQAISVTVTDVSESVGGAFALDDWTNGTPGVTSHVWTLRVPKSYSGTTADLSLDTNSPATVTASDISCDADSSALVSAMTGWPLDGGTPPVVTDGGTYWEWVITIDSTAVDVDANRSASIFT